MPVFNNALAGAAGSGGADAGYKIERSLRFNATDSGYLHRTVTTAGDRQKFTFSFWVKRGAIGNNSYNLFNASANAGGSNASVARTEFKFENDQTIMFAVWNGSWRVLKTEGKFRDVSAWYHIVLKVDTTQTTNANKVKIYVNGIEQTLTGNYPSTNELLPYNGPFTHSIGNYTNNYNDYFDGIMADIQFVDGQSLDATNFGEFDQDTGAWNPKKYTGTYGTNGFHLDFSDTSSNQSLGYDATVTGIRYSPFWTGSLATNYSFATLFDGSTSTLCLGANGATLTWIPETPISWTDAQGGVEVYYHNTSQPDKARVNGGSWVNQVSNSGGWEKVTTGDGTLTKLELKDQASSEVAVYAIRVNGNILTDPTGASDWYVQNLTNLRAATGNHGVTRGNSTLNYDPRVIFNGNIDSAYADRPINGNGVNFTGIPAATQSFRVYATYVQSGTMSASGSGQTLTVTGTNMTAQWYTPTGISYPFTLSSISVTGGNAGDGFGIGAIEVDGVVLDLGSGTDTDNLIDTPTNYENNAGDVGGNFCTWNQLDKANELVLSNGNLWVSESSGQQLCTRGTQWLSSGKWYWEVTVEGPSVHNGGQISIGVATGEQSYIGQPGAGGSKGSAVYWPSGAVYQNGTSKGNNSAYNHVGATIGVALDMDNKTIAWYLDGTLQSISCSNLEAEVAPLVHLYAPDDAVTLQTNFGQQPYKYNIAGTNRPAATYKTVCTQNRTPSTVPNGNNHVITKAYEGTGTTQLVESNFQPDFIWNERRNGGAAAVLSYGLNKFSTYLQLPATDQEYPASGMVPGSTGLTISGTGAGLNATGSTYVMRMFNGGDPINTFNTNSYDQSESWSVITTKSGGGTASGKGLENGFDGTTSTLAEGDSNNEYVEIPISTTISAGGVRVFAAVTSSNPLVINLYNGSSNVETVSGSNTGGQWYATSTYSGAITKIRIERTGKPWEFNAVEVNGKILTNAGLVTAGSLNNTVYNTSQSWSVSGSNMQNDWSASFDGKDSPSFALPNTGYSASMTFGTPINYSTLELVVSRDIYAPDLLMNGTALNVPATDTNTTGGQYVKERFRFYNGTLSSIGHNTRNTAGRGGSGFWYIIVDGKILVDQSQASSVPDAPGIPTITTVNNDAGISISRFTGTGSASSFATGLNKPADFVILKGTSFSDDYRVYHKSLDDSEPEDYYLILQNSTNKSADQQGSFMNDRAPNSGIVHLGTDSAINGSGSEMLALSFAEVPGFSKFGKYPGSQYHLGNGPFVWCGFRPELIIGKVFDGSLDPFMIWDDVRRNNRNPILTQMKLTEGGYESAEYADFAFDFTSNGFYVSGTSGQVNAHNQDFVFMAFAKNPFELARAV